MQVVRKFQQLTLASAILMVLFSPPGVLAQGMMGGAISCPMCANMGWGGMLLGGAFMLFMMGAFIYLIIYLFRRSGTKPH